MTHNFGLESGDKRPGILVNTGYPWVQVVKLLNKGSKVMSVMPSIKIL